MRIRPLATLVSTLVSVAASSVTADTAKPKPAPKAPTTGFWKVLVQPNAKWTLHIHGETEPSESSDFHPGPITIETYDVRKVGDADVARLRWRRGMDSSESALSGTHAPPLDQFAVTSAGLYILRAEMDDKKIAEVLKGKPSRSDPPKPYKGTTVNEGRYLEIRDDLVCIGQGPTPGESPCEDTCDGGICISATDGIVRLEGNWAPDMFDYVQVKPNKKRKTKKK